MAISRNNPFGKGRARKCLVPQFVKTPNLSSWKGVKKAASIASVLKITSRMAKEIVFWCALFAAIILEWTIDEPGGKGFSQLRVDVEFQLQIIIFDRSISPSLSREHHDIIRQRSLLQMEVQRWLGHLLEPQPNILDDVFLIRDPVIKNTPGRRRER